MYVIIFSGLNHITGMRVYKSDHIFSGWSQHWDGSMQSWSWLALSSPASLSAASWDLSRAARPLLPRWTILSSKCAAHRLFSLFSEGRTTRRRKATHTEQRNDNRGASIREWKSSKWTYHPFTPGEPDAHFHIPFHSFQSSFSWHWKNRLVSMKYVKIYRTWTDEWWWWCKCLYICLVNKFS